MSLTEGIPDDRVSELIKLIEERRSAYVYLSSGMQEFYKWRAITDRWQRCIADLDERIDAIATDNLKLIKP